MSWLAELYSYMELSLLMQNLFACRLTALFCQNHAIKKMLPYNHYQEVVLSCTATAPGTWSANCSATPSEPGTALTRVRACTERHGDGDEGEYSGSKT